MHSGVPPQGMATCHKPFKTHENRNKTGTPEVQKPPPRRFLLPFHTLRTKTQQHYNLNTVEETNLKSPTKSGIRIVDRWGWWFYTARPARQAREGQEVVRWALVYRTSFWL